MLLDWAGEDAVDEERLAADVDELVADFADLPLKDMRVGALIGRITAIVREHGIVLPSDLTLMFKALITLEGSARKYDPDFRLVDRLKPFVDRALAARYAPAEVGRRGGASLGHLLGLIGSMPRDFARLLKDARRGRLRIDLDLKRLDSFGRRLDSTIDRITIGIMTASVVIGSSIVMTVTSGPQLFGIPIFTVLGSLGFLMAFVNSVWHHPLDLALASRLRPRDFSTALGRGNRRRTEAALVAPSRHRAGRHRHRGRRGLPRRGRGLSASAPRAPVGGPGQGCDRSRFPHRWRPVDPGASDHRHRGPRPRARQCGVGLAPRHDPGAACRHRGVAASAARG